MLKKNYPEFDNAIPIEIDKEIMYSMNYFDKPVLLTKAITIDHLEDAMIRAMSKAKYNKYNQMQEYVNKLKTYPDDSKFLLKFKK